MNKPLERIYNGVIKENPTLVLMLGMCPTLAVTTSAINGVGMGLGFTISLTVIGMIRELFGAGTLFGFTIMPEIYTPVSILVLAPGAFLVLAILSAIQNRLKMPSATNVPHEELACGGNCAGCTGSACSLNHMKLAEAKAEEALKLQAEKKAAKENAKKEGEGK